MKNLIVNADDLGINSQVNDTIFSLIRQGRITSATIIANGAAAEDASKRSREFPAISFGVHLNASEFSPLSPTAGLTPILDQNGCFAGSRLREIAITRPLRHALLIEWSAQINKLVELGVRVSHLDSHHHVHTIPGVFPVIKQLQRRFGIKKVRASMNIYSERCRPRSKSLLFKKLLWNSSMRHIAVATSTTDGFTSLETFLQAAHELKQRFQTIELMVHPGNRDYQNEANMLAGHWECSLPFPIKLINYLEL